MVAVKMKLDVIPIGIDENYEKREKFSISSCQKRVPPWVIPVIMFNNYFKGELLAAQII